MLGDLPKLKPILHRHIANRPDKKKAFHEIGGPHYCKVKKPANPVKER